MRKRVYSGLAVTGIVFFVNLLACNMPLIRNLYGAGFIDKKMLTQNLVTGSYHTLLEYSVVVLFVFSFYINYVMENRRIADFTRYRSRAAYHKKRMILAALYAGLFVVVHEVESVIFLLYYGDVQALMEHHWVEGVLFQICTAVLYCMQYYLVYELISMKYRHTTAHLYAVGIFIAEYYLGSYFINNIWLPVYDVALLAQLCVDGITVTDCRFAVLRLLLVDFLLYQLMIRQGQREDCLRK